MPRVAKRGKKSGSAVRKWSARMRKSGSSTRKTVQRGSVGSNYPKKVYEYLPVRTLANQYAPLVSMAPVPKRRQFTLKYAEGGPTMSGMAVGTAGVGGTEIAFALNALFDPNITLTGHQPYYFDQLVACGYQRYRVDYVSIKVRAFTPNASDTGLAVQCDAWNGSAGTLTGVSWNTINERPGTHYLTPGLTSGEQCLVLERIPIWELQGMTKLEYQSDVATYAAAVTANPSRGPYLRIAAVNTSGSNAGTCDATVELTFHGEFFDPQLVAPS